ncbi:myelin-associated glycoprotein-like isoform X6 [Hippocampus comes]|uniref:myelin-associated glycoprotein-like isoform X5 n=1 Tax=Hippocampus comes TaxID=109280 RepID=UPI00094E4F96|nr:PREDICTED: myelin-associated glycoprotein-like isoform X5 [Hippocampus comes]XP_019741816.1 PREDICTED: myelin-associated glycoprotein-like isoform X6 [Hippocampus comes]
MNFKRRLMVLYVLIAGCRAALSGEWKATVVKRIDALVTSCVVLPCSFSHPKEQLPSSRLRGIWHLQTQRDQRIYHQDETNILASFRDRTRLLGHLGQGNCSLEMTQIKDYDNGPFCFRIELAPMEGDTSSSDKFSFVEDCVKLKMLPAPPKPTLTLHANIAYEGLPYTVVCSVTYTCPTHGPSLTWSRGNAHEVTTVIKEIHSGFWEAQSILIIIPEAKDDHSEVTCKASFYGGMSSSDKFTLFVKRTKNHHHIIVPSVVAVGITVLFGGLCIVMVKKYKKRISELQDQSSMRDRLSRLSRRSRRPRENMMELNHLPSTSTSGAGQKFCKPPRPSPKSQPGSSNYKPDISDADDYENTAYLNVYRNC